jgi:hypothetical protein
LTSRFSTEFDLELSKRIYGVNESFKNIVDVVLKQSKVESIPSALAPLVPSLALMCANVIGEHIQPDMDDKDLDDENDMFQHHLEEEMNKAVEEVYEAVPPEHRKWVKSNLVNSSCGPECFVEHNRWTLISHALTLVLTMCPTNHTLLSVLLETCLAKGLLIESTILLEKLLKNAMTPSKPYQNPPLLHPAHSGWLFYLYISWLGNNSDIFTDRAFVRVLVSTISSVDPRVWSCKALSKLAIGLQQRDFAAFVQLVSALMDNIHSIRDMSNSKSPELEDSNALCDRSAKWIKRLLEHIYQEPENTADTEARATMIYNLLGHDILTEMLSQPETYPSNLVDSLLSLSTSFLFSTHSSEAQDLVRALQYISVTPTTFDSLVPIIFSNISLPTSSWTSILMGRIQRHSQILQKLGLLRLNASFTARCQRYFESSTFHPPVYENDDSEAALAKMQKLRKWLIELVDDAEKKCFGSNPDFGYDLTAGARVDNPRDDERKTGRWVYHDVVDAWVKASPTPRQVKRRKVSAGISASTTTSSRARKPPIRPPKFYDTHTSRGRAASVSRSVASETDSIFQTTTGSTASTVSYSRSPSLSPASGCDSDDEDCNITRLTKDFDAMTTPRGKENVTVAAKTTSRHQVQKSQMPADRRRSFATVLTDSLANHTVLHPNRRSGAGNLFTSISAPASWKTLEQDYDPSTNVTKFVPPSADNEVVDIDDDDDIGDESFDMGDVNFASSDDALDMFNVLSSSPLRSRGRRF